ncbi:MAG: 4-(cytidine 5'-diphospho)-2-C-methyl-D-erythritol kinase [Acidobacteriota bacterium]|nr:4-(cytidine 5'-diphospho)-2-C-methyl-D-erythritol kinase [Acidobacteriota bacterium]
MSETPFTLPSFAKLNLYLEVIGKRDDGYHELCTVFQTVSLHDDLTFSTGDSIRLTCNDKKIPADDRNLIVKAAKILREKFDIHPGAGIHLEKRIPAPGGLGGGSSNAAITLLGLKKLWSLEVGFDELLEIGRMLGSDVPFFLYGGTSVGTGRGTEVKPLADIVEKQMLIVIPDVSVSTRDAFEMLNAPNLTTDAAKSILNNCRFDTESIDLRHSAIKNDFETTVFAAYPEIKTVKQTLLDLGAVNASMSGSGASVFGIFDTEETRQTAMKALDEQVNWRTFAVAAVSRDEYRDKLGLAM